MQDPAALGIPQWDGRVARQYDEHRGIGFYNLMTVTADRPFLFLIRDV